MIMKKKAENFKNFKVNFGSESKKAKEKVQKMIENN